MDISVFELIRGLAFLVGLGVVLHLYAFAIAWGAAKGWSKVKHVVEQTGTVTQKWITEEPKSNR